MNTHYRVSLVIGIITALCAGCAQTSRDELTLEERLAKRNFEIEDPVDRIHDYRIDGWAYVDREHIIIHGGVSRRYLITLTAPCSDLRTEEDISFTTTASVLTPFDRIVVNSPIGPRHCWIKEIHALSRRE